MNEVLLTVMFIAERALLLSGIGAGIAAVLGRSGFALGLMVGSIYSIANLALLGIGLTRAIEAPPARIGRFIGWRYLGRHTLTAAVLYLTLRWGTPQFIGAVTGLSLSKLVILTWAALGYRGRWG